MFMFCIRKDKHLYILSWNFFFVHYQFCKSVFKKIVFDQETWKITLKSYDCVKSKLIDVTFLH